MRESLQAHLKRIMVGRRHTSDENLFHHSLLISVQNVLLLPHSMHTITKHKTVCINKITKEDGIDISKLLTSRELDYIGLNFNLRKENNLYVFETLKEDQHQFNNNTIELADKNYDIRPYDPLSNYINQCKRCHLIGHTTYDCKKRFACTWCGKEDCGRKCKEEDRTCINCKGKHSSLYKGCPIYKKALENASKIKNEKTKETKIKNISKDNYKLQQNFIKLEQSYANVVQQSTTNKKIELQEIENNIIKINTHNEKHSNDMEAIKNNLHKIINVTTNTQSKLVVLATKIDENIQKIDKIQKTTINKEQLINILFELSYALANGKLVEKTDIAYHLIAIVERNSGEIDKAKIIKNISNLDQTSPLLTEEETNQEQELKNGGT